MPDYKKLYHFMFNQVTDIIENLKDVQKEAEEIYIQSCEEEEGPELQEENDESKSAN